MMPSLAVLRVSKLKWPRSLLFLDDLKAKYCEEGVLNQGGFGTVYYGYRKSDNLPVRVAHSTLYLWFCSLTGITDWMVNEMCVSVSKVAIKHIPKPNLKFISMVSGYFSYHDNTTTDLFQSETGSLLAEVVSPLIRPPSAFICTKFVNGGRRILPREVALMLKVKEMGKASNNVVDLLDWCELPNELILILQRPVPCMDLFDYMGTVEGIMYERKAKVCLLTFYEIPQPKFMYW